MERTVNILFPKNTDRETITSGILSGSMSVENILCTEKQLSFKNLASNCFKCSLIYDDDLTGEYIKVVMTEYINENSINTYTIFKGIVDSCVLQKGGIYKDLVAYDELSKIKNTDITNWYNETMFPNGTEEYPLYQFIGSLLEEIGLTYAFPESDFSSLMVKKTLEGTVIKAETLLTALCEIECKFGGLNEDNYFTLFSLGTEENDITANCKSSSNYADYIVPEIVGVKIEDSEDEVGGFYGEEENVYTILGNPFLTDLEHEILDIYAEQIFGYIAGISYTPLEIDEIIPDLSLNLGDKIIYGDNVGYILQSTYSGALLFNSQLKCEGDATVRTVEKTLEDSYELLNNKFVKVSKSIEGIETRVGNLESETESAITQTGNKISMSVKKGNEIVSIELGEVDESGNLILTAEAKDIMLTSDNIKIISDNFNVDEKGNVTLLGDESMLRVRNTDVSVDIDSKSNDIFSIYNCPLVLEKSNISNVSNFESIHPGLNICTFNGNILSCWTNVVWQYVESENNWEAYDYLNSKYSLKCITVYNDNICLFGMDTNLNKSILRLNGVYKEIDNDTSEYQSMVVYNDLLFFINGNHLYQCDKKGTITTIDLDVSSSGYKKLKVINDNLYILDGEYISKLHFEGNNVKFDFSKNSVGTSSVIYDLDMLGSNYIALIDNCVKFSKNDLYTFTTCYIIDGDDEYSASGGNYGTLLHLDNTILVIGGKYNYEFYIYETCDCINLEKLYWNPDLYPRDLDKYDALFVDNTVFTPFFRFDISIGSVTQDSDQITNIYKVSKDGDVLYSGDLFKFENESNYDSNDEYLSQYETFLKVSNDIIDEPTTPEYRFTNYFKDRLEERETRIDAGYIKLENKSTINEKTTSGFASINPKAINLYYTDDESDQFTGYYTATGQTLKGVYNDFNLDDNTLNFELEQRADGQTMNVETKNGTFKAKARLNHSRYEILDAQDEPIAHIKQKECLVKSGIYDGGFKLYGNSLNYAYGGLTCGWSNGYDIHTVLYSYSGSSTQKPSIKVEQKNSTGTVNEAYLLNGSGNTSFPNSVSASYFSASYTVSANKFTAPYYEVTDNIKLGKDLQAYAGMDMPYVNGTDIHGCIYAMSQSYYTKPCVTVEQRNLYGTLNEAYILDGNGDTRLPNTLYSNTSSSTSDRKLKDVIRELDEQQSSDFINALNPVEYTFKDNNTGRLHMGFIAQDVKSVCDNVGYGNMAMYSAYKVDEDGNRIGNFEDNTPDEKLRWYMSYNEIIAPMVKTIQSLTKRIEELEKQLK